jgi:hypothetical protein
MTDVYNGIIELEYNHADCKQAIEDIGEPFQDLALFKEKPVQMKKAVGRKPSPRKPWGRESASTALLVASQEIVEAGGISDNIGLLMGFQPRHSVDPQLGRLFQVPEHVPRVRGDVVEMAVVLACLLDWEMTNPGFFTWEPSLGTYLFVLKNTDWDLVEAITRRERVILYTHIINQFRALNRACYPEVKYEGVDRLPHPKSTPVGTKKVRVAS